MITDAEADAIFSGHFGSEPDQLERCWDFEEWRAKYCRENLPPPKEQHEGPDYGDGPDSGGFKGPRPWNNFEQPSALSEERVIELAGEHCMYGTHLPGGKYSWTFHEAELVAFAALIAAEGRK